MFWDTPADPPDPVSSTAARDPPTTRAGGQDDGSYTQLFKLLIVLAIGKGRFSDSMKQGVEQKSNVSPEIM